MNIWPWSKINEVAADQNKWLQAYMDIYKSRNQVLRYLDKIEPGYHECVADKLYVFKKDGEWVLVDPKEEV